MIEVYRGSANAWECDEMGHMNVRFYVARMMEGLMELAHVIGIPYAFSETSASTLVPRDTHTRNLREAKAGEPLTLYAGIVEIKETSALIHFRFDHRSGDACATYLVWVDHVDRSSNEPFPWSTVTKERLETLRATPDTKTGPRSLDMTIAPAKEAIISQADAINAPTIGRGVVLPGQCDGFGIMLPEFFIGRVSDSIGHLLGDWREKVANTERAQDNQVRTGGAVLESRWIYRRWPKTGDRFVIRTGLAFVSDKVHSFHHWMLDPVTGQAWATNQTIAITFDLDKRKVIATPQSHQDSLKQLIPTGLHL